MNHQKWVNKLANFARKNGWKVSIGKHYKFTNPAGDVVTVSGSPSSTNTRKAIVKDFKENGLIVEIDL